MAGVRGKNRAPHDGGRKAGVVKLTDTGESRVNGYLFVLGRSFATFLPPDTRQDAVREVESHLRERIAAATPGADERAALEKRNPPRPRHAVSGPCE
jgi:HAAS domain-containing protein